MNETGFDKMKKKKKKIKNRDIHMKWIQIKNLKWIGGSAEEYTQIKNPKHPHEEDRD